ncbi:unnamed protein product [Gulo gulo]|uniref:Uncharacterized protein n=1 Tax=Gulo gulo TaxID=48420 RepID=A0A9X9PUD9_GULGU|nr:unnamed protein product [Gulo gulo]
MAALPESSTPCHASSLVSRFKGRERRQNGLNGGSRCHRHRNPKPGNMDSEHLGWKPVTVPEILKRERIHTYLFLLFYELWESSWSV